MMEEISLVLEQADSLVKDSDLFNSCDDDDDDGICPDIIPISPSSSETMTAATPEGDAATTTEPATAAAVGKNGKAKKRTWKKPKDKPKRPLSAYNIFFQHEREKIITDAPEQELSLDFIISVQKMASKRKEKRRHRKTHGKIGFADLARKIAEKWKKLDGESKSYFEARADAEKARYKRELEVWNRKRHMNKDLLDDEDAATTGVGDDDDEAKLDMDQDIMRSRGMGCGAGGGVGGKNDKMPNEMMPKQSLTALMAQSHSFLQEQMMQSSQRHPNVVVTRSHPGAATAAGNVPSSMVLSYSGGNNNPYINNFPYHVASPSHCSPDYLDVAQQTFNMARSTLAYPSHGGAGNMGFPASSSMEPPPGRRPQFNGGYGSNPHHDVFFEPIGGDDQDQQLLHDDGAFLHFDPHAGMNSPGGLFDAAPSMMQNAPKFHPHFPQHLLHPFDQDGHLMSAAAAASTQQSHLHRHAAHQQHLQRMQDDFGNFMEHFERE